jgi:hypothetical protein
MHLPHLLGAAALAAALVPATASASSLTLEGDAIVWHGDPTAESAYVGLGADQYGREDAATIWFQGPTLGAAPAGCVDGGQAYGDRIVTCPMPATVRLDLGGGDDRVTSGWHLPAALRLEASGGDGDDRLEGFAGTAPALLDGGPGNDVLVSHGADVLLGGDGNDDLQGRDQPDRLDGGAGDDVLAPDGSEPQAADVVEGGPGVDRIESDWSDRTQPSLPNPPVAITLAGGADDGRPGEGDDIHGVEVITTHQASTLVGTDAPEHLEAFQTLGASTITGNGGDDELKGSGGPDLIDGGAGADTIDAGFGDDVITGGPGRDVLFGDRRGGDCGPLWCTYPYGNDVIDARDGEQDSVSCGAGTDRVTADAVDVVDSDCEQVDRAAAAAPAAAGSTPATARRRATVSPAGRPRLRTALRHGLSLRLAGMPKGKVVARAREGGRTVASGTGRAGTDGRATVRLRFTGAAARRLAGRRSVRLTVVAGAARRTVTLAR